MRAFYADQFVLPLPPGHRFPMEKYARLRRRVEESGLIPADCLQVPPPATNEELGLVHTAGYLEKVIHGLLTEKEIRRMGFPWSPGLVERSRRSVGGTIAASRAALGDGLAANLAGGTHHAYPDHGEGYCVFNDVAVAARVLLREGAIQKAAVIDCDVHQGNGTAAIFQGDERVFTFSIHGEHNFPFHKETSDLDVALPDQAGDALYLDLLEPAVREVLAQSRPDLVFYLAGADPFVGDRLGRMALSKPGLVQRDRLVLELCREEEIPVAVVMSGGYAKEIDDTVDIHFQTIQTAAAFAAEACSSRQ